ncbi:agmatine deiminase family protein [Erythrobacter mangrovi]|uniref:Agmatine deiminase family protein n=1 Tax=Erythrobacter mangrovi TaxID=2739433 RepID=A0A7D3XPA8_9SPHN|nr:agmatine deiminase family protein [Erythrobacter mangrovi]QKG70794.1 agmatine deiminase family protein [Erythrobacter mangrovi]
MPFTMPPEWAPQDWLWIGFPHDADEWPDVLPRAQEQIAAFASAVADSGQEVRLLVRDAANEARARSLVSSAVRLERRHYGDVWLRDTGPLVLCGRTGRRSARRFGFNGWGGKYLMDGDQTIGAELAQDADLEIVTGDWILEGGAIDGDGTGLVATTEQCLLNPNRNPRLTQAQIEERLKRDLGFTRVLWLGDGLINDHTDGHVDNLARFVAPNTLCLPRATGNDDPNAAIYADAKARAQAAGVIVKEIPSPGRIASDGRIEPASYANFAITTHLVVVPTFGSPFDEEGVAAIAELFPDRATVGLPGDAVLAGGGGFHCASQQMPAAGWEA